MSPSQDAIFGSILAASLVTVDIALIVWQIVESRRRGPDVSEEDRSYYASRDVRRWIIAFIIACLAAGVFIGSRLPYIRDDRLSLPFFGTWLAVFGLVLMLVFFALIDWFATRRFARRHRTAIVREGMELIREEIRVRSEHRRARKSSEGTNGSV